MSVISELEGMQRELDGEKKAIVEARDAEIAAAKEKYVQGLKAVNAKMIRVKAMIKTATALEKDSAAMEGGN
ncbi:MAG: hypothetical protein NTY64_04120 [Deltaproteobacteria bacterium]|nr:hypothetical protein [Deltaproteobacteria bacterium]